MKTRFIILTIMVLVIFGMTGCGNSDSLSGRPGMLYFYSDTWPICQRMKPVVSGIEDKYGDDFKIVHINVRTTKGKEKASEHYVLGTPTMVMFDDSGREMRRLMGYQASEDLEEAIDRILGR